MYTGCWRSMGMYIGCLMSMGDVHRVLELYGGVYREWGEQSIGEHCKCTYVHL